MTTFEIHIAYASGHPVCYRRNPNPVRIMKLWPVDIEWIEVQVELGPFTGLTLPEEIPMFAFKEELERAEL